MQQISEAYRKIRNTCRFLDGQPDDFDPQQDTVMRQDILEIDRWPMDRLQRLVARVTRAMTITSSTSSTIACTNSVRWI